MINELLTKIDWESWAALTVVLGAFGFLVKKFLPTREEYNEFKESILLVTNKLTATALVNKRDIKGLFAERASFRQEVLMKVEQLDERVGIIARDLSDLKDFLLENK